MFGRNQPCNHARRRKAEESGGWLIRPPYLHFFLSSQDAVRRRGRHCRRVREEVEVARRWADPESALPFDAPVRHPKMPNVTCALARAQSSRPAEFLTRPAEIALLYYSALESKTYRILRAPEDHSETWRGYLMAIERNAPCEPRWEGRGDFVASERLLRALVSVPISPSLTEGGIAHIKRTLRRVVASG